jgi:hypothetical protein
MRTYYFPSTDLLQYKFMMVIYARIINATKHIDKNIFDINIIFLDESIH